MKLQALSAVPTNPDVVPAKATDVGSIWAAIPTILGVIVQVMALVSANHDLPDVVTKWAGAIGAGAGIILHLLFGKPTYVTPPPPPAPPPPVPLALSPEQTAKLLALLDKPS